MKRLPTFTPMRSLLGRLRCRRIAPRLVPYSEGKLGRNEREKIEAHLDDCAPCSDALAAIASVSASLIAHSNDDFEANGAPSSDLWARIHAEICPVTTPATAWDAPTQPVRRRMVFGLDPSWPNTLPVGIAIASALLFGVVLAGGHRNGGGAGNRAETASVDASIVPSPISVSLQSAGPNVEVASAPMIRPLHLRVRAANLLPAKPAEALAEARELQSNAGRTDPFALVAPEKIQTAAVASAPAQVRAAAVGLLVPAIRPGGLVASRSSYFFAGSAVNSAVAKSNVALGLSAGTPSTTVDGLAYSNGSRPDAAYSSLDGTVTPAVDLPAETASVSAPGIVAAAAPDQHAVAATTADGSDASIRGNTPAALPMVDLAASTRRQRGLFSYASR